ncbi:MAG: exosortase-dependent surface protein XDP2 [Oscillatoria sp. PMC 1068.18]|nr:exosortase-dependent surface protein XDP2 [Oscillatoria sp. PMC 1076.18]MEC4990068.1 exosortase-dependent surface protein XDP2 [Oscillatoria sp. PMC 1068.18]
MNQKIINFYRVIGLIVLTITFFNVKPTYAFNFTTNFTSTLTGDDAAKGDIWLNSIESEAGEVFNNFSLVTGGEIISNDIWTEEEVGASSADKGDLATVGIQKENITDEDLTSVLGNLNLNSIIDTEDTGKSAINLFFDQAVDNLFFWERGLNSKLDIQALDTEGNLIGNLFTLNSENWQYAGFDIDTLEINSAQKVGSIGVSLADLGVQTPISGIRVTTLGEDYNGPDWKVVGSTASVPESSSTLTLLGLGTIGLFGLRRRLVN